MSLTPQLLINDAILSAVPYVAEHTVAPGQLLRQLSELDKEVADIYITSVPERLSVAGTDILVVPATNLTGYTLTAGRMYSDLKWVDLDGNETNIFLVDERSLHTPAVHPAGIIRGVKFYPADPLGQGWAGSAARSFFIGNSDVIRYRYVPEPGRVTTMAQVLASPDEAASYLRLSLTLTLVILGGAPQLVVENIATARARARVDLVLGATKR